MYIPVNDPHLDIINTFQGEKLYSFCNVSLYQEYTDVLRKSAFKMERVPRTFPVVAVAVILLCGLIAHQQ